MAVDYYWDAPFDCDDGEEEESSRSSSCRLAAAPVAVAPDIDGREYRSPALPRQCLYRPLFLFLYALLFLYAFEGVSSDRQVCRDMASMA